MSFELQPDPTNPPNGDVAHHDEAKMDVDATPVLDGNDGNDGNDGHHDPIFNEKHMTAEELAQEKAELLEIMDRPFSWL